MVNKISINTISELNIPEDFQERLTALNNEFLNTEIDDAVSIIYYPVQSSLSSGHSELVIEDRCYYIFDKVKSKSLANKIFISQSGGFPFKQCHIRVSLAQLAKIKEVFENTYGLNCMHGISRVLSKSVDFHIPPVVNLSPLMSYIYLCRSKALGNRRITKIESYKSADSSIRDFLITSIGVTNEVIGIISATGILLFGFKSLAESFYDVFVEDL